MKVALFIDSLVRGGAERQALYTFQELRRRGIDVRLIYYYQSPLEFDLPESEASRFVYLPKSGRPLMFLYRLWRYLRREKFDIVHGFKDTPCFYGAIATRLSRTPVFIAGHRTQGMPVGIYRYGMMVVNRLCSAWIGNSKAIGQSLMNGLGTAPDQLFTVYNGIDPAAFQSPLSAPEAKAKFGISKDQSVVTIIAVLRGEKNHAMFMRMAALVARRHPETVFLIAGCPVAGDTTTQPGLEILSRELGVADQTRFMGLRPDVPDILAATDVLVLTSHLEGMSNALLESMAAGVPFVTTSYAGVDELVRDGIEGFVVPLNDHAAMAEQVCLLISDQTLRERMGRAGRATVQERFSIPAMGENLLRVYGQLLGSGGRDRRLVTS